MAPSPPRLRILSVGGNAVSAFLSWRLQATNACDVTLVWKNSYDVVSQYGISFKSKLFGNERFRPHKVVRSPEEAAGRIAFDYVLLCVKALPDVYDMAAVIESVVTPQHTCILVNTTNTIGVEAHLEQRFPTNVVLSLVSGAEIMQLGPSEFEHVGATEVWVGPANKNPTIPVAIQNDMSEALAMTLSTGQVDCKVSPNIRQQQYERMIGPIAFHPASVLLETPSHAELMEKVGVRQMVSDIIEELVGIAMAQGCSFPSNFKESTVAAMVKPSETNSIMYQDFLAKRPMEVETYLGSPIKLAQEAGTQVPRIETLYALLYNFNVLNQSRLAIAPPSIPSHANGLPPNRNATVPIPRSPSNGMYHGVPNGGPRSRAPSLNPGGPPGRRGPPSVNGYGPRPPNGYQRGPPSNQLSRRPSFEPNDLEEFSHLALIDDIPEGGVPGFGEGNLSSADLALRERELMIRQRELQLREREYQMQRGGRRGASHRTTFDDDDDDDDDYFDPTNAPPVPQIDPDNFDMMSVTSRRNRKAPGVNNAQFRRNPEAGSSSGGSRGPRQSHSFGGLRPSFGGRNRASARLLSDVPGLHDSILENPLAAYSSDRYGNVDRKNIGDQSRTSSLTAARLNELQGAGNNAGMNGAYPSPHPAARRTSLSPGHPLGPGGRPVGRPSPPGDGYLGPNGYPAPNGYPQNGYPGRQGPSPPGMMRQPTPKHPPGQGNAVAPQQVEQHAGVSNPNLYPSSKGTTPIVVRSLTGSASASAGSGDSAPIDSENSAHSSQSSFGVRPPIGVR